MKGGVKGPPREGVSLGSSPQVASAGLRTLSQAPAEEYSIPVAGSESDSLNLAQFLHPPPPHELTKPCSVSQGLQRGTRHHHRALPHILFPQSSGIPSPPTAPTLVCFSVHVCVQPRSTPPSQLPLLKFSQQT